MQKKSFVWEWVKKITSIDKKKILFIILACPKHKINYKTFFLYKIAFIEAV
jgi:hypothetical protein